MKLEKITIQNIASIEDASIDFSNGPLADDHIFLICGPTGSGKTTILDCISLALFDQTPRIASDSKNIFRDAISGEELKTDDQRQFMRRGAGSCKIELTFSIRNETFTAIWECNRANNKPDGKLQQRKRRILDNSGTQIESKLTDVENFITEKLNLTYEQFCKTTMLAQGEFTRFLKADEKEKSDILEKLTGTEIYSEISKTIKAIWTDKDNEVRDINVKLEGIHVLSEDEIKERKESIDAKEKEMTEKETEQKATEDKLSWISNHENTEKELQDAKKALAESTVKKNSEEYKTQKKDIADWKRSVEAQTLLSTKKEKEKNFQQAESKKSTKNAAFHKFLKGQNFLKNEVLLKREALKDLNRTKESFAANADMYEAAGILKTCFNDIRKFKGEISQKETENLGYSNNIPDLETKYQKAQTKYQECKNNDDGIKAKIEVETEKLKKMNLTQLEKQRSEAENKIESLNNLKQMFKDYAEAIHNRDQNQTDIKTAEATIEEYTSQIKELGLEALANDVNLKTSIYEKAKETCSDFVKELRASLSLGECCPVCGRSIDEHLDNQDFESKLEPLKTQKEEAESKHKTAQGKANEFGAIIHSENDKINNCKKNIAELETKVTEKETALKSHPLYPTYENIEQPTEAITRAVEEVVKEKEKISAKISAVDEQQGKIESLTREKRTSESELETARSEQDKALAAKDANEKKISDNKITITSRQNDICAKEKELNRHMTIDNWKEEWEKDENVFENQIAEDAKLYKANLQAIEKQERLLNNDKNILTAVDKTISEIQKLRLGWLTAESKESEQVDNLQNGVAEFKGELETFKQQLDTALKEKNRASENFKVYSQKEDSLPLERLEELMRINSTTITANEEKINEIDVLFTQRETSKNNLETKLAELIQKKPEISEEDTAENLQNRINKIKEDLQQMSENMGRLKKELEDNETNKEKYAVILADKLQKESEKDEWKMLYDLFGSADGKKFRTIAQSFVLGNLIDCANVHLRKFSERYELYCQPGTLTIIIKDLDAGGVIRPASTLSGGESFIASLSLALGLSSLTKMDNAIDTLFIDEGFGTLDGTYLPKVLEALEKLHANEGKKIGIISHVELLRDRIPTKIKVTPEGTKSKIEVISE